MRGHTGLDETDAQTDEDIFRECRDFLQSVIDAESDNRKRAIDDLKFRDGEQWPESLYKERELDGRLSLTINHTDTFVSRVENNLKQQRPRIKCHPVGDGADKDKAEVINGVIRHIENRSQASVAYDAGGSSALSMGWGYWRVVPEYLDEKSFEQELRIVPIRNPFTVYRDPASIMPDGSDSMRYVVSEKIKRTKYKQLYPKADNASHQSGGPGDEDLEWESKTEIRLAEYFRIIEKPERLFKMQDGKTLLESDFEPGVLKEALKNPDKHGFALELKDGERVPVERKSSKRQVQWFRLNGCKVVDRRDLPGRYIPIIACEGNCLDLNGKKSRAGMIKNLKEPARMVNYWETMKTERLALAPKAEWTAFEGVIEGHPEWHDANRKAYSVLVGKAVAGPDGSTLPLPTKQQPAAVESGMTEAMQSAYSALMAMAGQPHDPGQDRRGEVVSGIALEERRELADTTHFQYYDNQTFSIAFTGRILLDLIPYYYDTQRMQRIIGEDGVPQMITINERAQNPENPAVQMVKNDLTVGTYDVVMDTGPGYDTKRQEGAETLINLVKVPVLGEMMSKAGPDLITRAIDAPYMDEMADRLSVQTPDGMKKAIESLPKQAQAIVTTLQGQLTQTQQALQHALLELKYKTGIEQGWMHVEREKNKDNVKAKVHDTETKAHTAHDVAEIQAAATLLNTHTEAAHEKEAAKLLLKSAEKAETEH